MNRWALALVVVGTVVWLALLLAVWMAVSGL